MDPALPPTEPQPHSVAIKFRFPQQDKGLRGYYSRVRELREERRYQRRIAALPELVAARLRRDALRELVKVGTRHYFLALPLIAAVIASALALQALWPVTRHSILTIVAALFADGPATPGEGTEPTWVTAVKFGFIGFIVTMLLRRGAVTAYAGDEELEYRYGSELLGWPRRIARQFQFGAIHLLNVIVPLAVVPGLTSIGLAFLFIYLRAHGRTGNPLYATARATEVHVAYNRIILTVAVALIAVVVVAMWIAVLT